MQRRVGRNRIRQMEEMEEINKRQFQQVLESQNRILTKLSKLAEKSTQIVQEMVKKDPQAQVKLENFKIPVNQSPSANNIASSFKQKEIVKDGPIL
jgi:hypothetical protein